jgi:serine/threonine protein kinase
LKAFDPSFIRQFGDEVQIKRIERQLLLRGKHHDHLIDILDGGYCAANHLHFLVMPLLPVPSLEKVLDKIPRENIWSIISQVAAAARFLEGLDMYHRDIKPANIAVTGSNFDHAILLDLGVLKPLGLRDLTDTTNTKAFVGTARYSPPEFLVRDEDDSADGFRAVTFYQLGAVLHDLIMRRPLFHDKQTPYPRLVQAVLLEEPIVDAADVPVELVRLSRICLTKDPARRAKSLTWESFNPRPKQLPLIEDAKRRAAQLRAAITSAPAPVPSQQEHEKLKVVAGQLRDQLKQACLDDGPTFPPVAITGHDRTGRSAHISLDFASSMRHGLPQKLSCMFRIDLHGRNPWRFSVHASAAIIFGEVAPDLNSAPFRSLGDAFIENELLDVCSKATYAAVLGALEESTAGLSNSDELKWIKLEGS